MSTRAALTKAREAISQSKWRDAALVYLQLSSSSAVAAWAVGKALLATQDAAALRFIRAAAYSGHPQAIDHMRSRPENNPTQAGYWTRFMPHITINGQLPSDDPESLKALLRTAGANSLYMKGWALQQELLGAGTDSGLSEAHEHYRLAAEAGNPLATVAHARTWDAYYAQEMTFEQALSMVNSSAASCPPALYLLAEQMLIGRLRAPQGEALRLLREAATHGERSAMELLGTMEPRNNDYLAQLTAAAELGSVRAMKALARSVEQPQAIKWLIKALGEELPGSISSRAIIRLAHSLKESGNIATAFSVLTEGESVASCQPKWALAQEEAREEYQLFVKTVADGLASTAQSPFVPASPVVSRPDLTSSTVTGAPPRTALTSSSTGPPSTPPHLHALSDSTGNLKPLPAVFSVEAFLYHTGLSGPDIDKFVEAVQRENCATETEFLALSMEELQTLGLSKLGDRKRFLAAAKSWNERKEALQAQIRDNVNNLGMLIKPTDLDIQGDPLGEGNFGAVYCGTFNMAKVAVKILHDTDDGRVDDEEFRKEARTLKELTDRGHPNVLRFFGICKLDLQEPKLKGWCIVTEFMANGSLKSFLVDNAHELYYRQLLNFAKSAAAGMAHLSSQNPPILHRDLAARNLLVGDYDKKDDTYALRVADFGLARAEVSGEYSVNGRSAVPIRWTAPEVWSSRKYSVAADVWSFGVTMWEIFTKGRRPYENWPDNTIIPRITAGERLPHTSNFDFEPIPKEVHDVMLACWNADPAKRPSFKDLFTSLAKLESAAPRREELPPVKSPRGPQPPPNALPRSTSNTSSRSSSSSLGGASPVVPPISHGSGSSASFSPPSPSVHAPATPPRLGAALPLPPEADPWDDDAKGFWRACCGRYGNNPVPEAEFIEGFKQYFSLQQWARLPENVVIMGALAELLVRQGTVKAERFARVLAWFGPLSPVKEFLLRLTKLMQQPWFHGEISTQDAALLVSRPPAPVGSFLMRFSTSEPGAFAFTLTGSGSQPRVAHYRLGHEGKDYTFKIGNSSKEIRSPSLRELVTTVKRQLGCQWPCTGSPYAHLFADAKAFADAYGTEL